MPTAIETVTNFLDDCAKGNAELHQAFRTYFTPQTRYENIGWSDTTGIDEAIEIIRTFEKAIGMATFRVDMLAIAADGNRVLTERIDYMVDADGKDFMNLAVMGVFEVSDGKITAWRDYFDTAGFTPPKIEGEEQLS